MKDLKFMATLWPSFPHFPRFVTDNRLAGVRLNSAMITNPELEKELQLSRMANSAVPLYFDVKGRQLRVMEVHQNPNYLDITLNHPIDVPTPTVVLFKAAADWALLERIEDKGRRLIFQGGPKYTVEAGESLHIRHPDLRVSGNQFVPTEIKKIEQVKAAGFKRYFLSYVQNQRDVDEFQEMVGRDSIIYLKIEDKKGLEYVAKDFRKEPNLFLVAAQGDLYVEINRPHEILSALKLIIGKDSEACVGSRLMLSVIHEPVPSCADFEQLAWLYEIGYRRMMLCDEICLEGDLLSAALDACQSFKETYQGISATQAPDLQTPKKRSWWPFGRH